MKEPEKEKSNGERAVLVTTVHLRGVFFGYASETSGETIKLRAARLCLYWNADRGFMGLAASGPNAACRIGPPADIEIRAVTSVTEVSSKAVEKWEKAPWKE